MSKAAWTPQSGQRVVSHDGAAAAARTLSALGRDAVAAQGCDVIAAPGCDAVAAPGSNAVAAPVPARDDLRLQPLWSVQAALGTELAIDVRGTPLPATVVAMPFYSRPTTD